jgi:hypothetical protein
MPIIIECEQGGDEWKKLRAGNLGASSVDKIITTKGERSKQRDDLLRQLAAEFITGQTEETFVSQAMLNGIAREPASRALFEMVYGVDVRKVGLVYKDERRLFHASPDGLVGDYEGLEMKNPSARVHVKYLLEKVLPIDYYQQIQMSLYVTERNLWYFMSSYEGLPPFIVEVTRNEQFIGRLAEELESFAEDLAAVVIKIEECGGIVQMAKIYPREEGATRPGSKSDRAVAAVQAEEMCPKECPSRPGDVMTKKFCDKTCKDRLGCEVWS